MKLFIFGATGDLVKRKILPALKNLEERDLEIYAIGRKDFDTQKYLEQFCEEYPREFREKIKYVKIDYEGNFFEELLKYLDKKQANYFYLTLPPKIYLQVLKQLIEIKKQRFDIKILLEKPFGANLTEAKKIKEFIDAEVISEDILLSDHYLFKKEINELKKKDFKKIKIYATEKLGLENRTSYYDEIGALKDMIQSHLFSTLLKIYQFNLKDIQVMKYIRGQYEDYEIELGKKSDTETFAYLLLRIEDKEVILFSGKKMDKKEIGINIDNKKIIIESNGDYENLIKAFLNDERDKFPKIEQALLSWEIVEKVEKMKSKLIIYKQGSTAEEILRISL